MVGNEIVPEVGPGDSGSGEAGGGVKGVVGNEIAPQLVLVTVVAVRQVMSKLWLVTKLSPRWFW